MNTDNLKWIKSFRIKPNDQFFNFYIAAHKNDYYTSVIIHFRNNELRQNKSIEPQFTFITKHFGDKTEERLIDQAHKYLKDEFPSKDYELIELEKNNFK